MRTKNACHSYLAPPVPFGKNVHVCHCSMGSLNSYPRNPVACSDKRRNFINLSGCGISQSSKAKNIEKFSQKWKTNEHKTKLLIGHRGARKNANGKTKWNLTANKGIRQNLLNRAHNEIETIQKKIEVSKRNGLVEKVSFLCTVETKMMTVEQKRWKSPKRMENLNEQEQRHRNWCSESGQYRSKNRIYFKKHVEELLSPETKQAHVAMEYK